MIGDGVRDRRQGEAWGEYVGLGVRRANSAYWRRSCASSWETMVCSMRVLCYDVLTSGVQEPGLGGHGGHQNLLGLIGKRCGAGSRFALRRRGLSVS